MNNITISNAQEREERIKLGQGLGWSIAAFLLCWLPFLNIIFSAVGFVRTSTRITIQHKKRRIIYTCVSLLVLVLCVAVFVGQIYVYVRRPTILTDLKNLSWNVLSGTMTSDDAKNELIGMVNGSAAPSDTGDGTSYPEGYVPEEGQDYSGMENPGLGIPVEGDAFIEGDMPIEGDANVPDEGQELPTEGDSVDESTESEGFAVPVG